MYSDLLRMSLPNTFFNQPIIVATGNVIAALTTATIHTPVAGKRFVLTDAILACFGANTTTVEIVFGLDSQSVVPKRVAIASLSTPSVVHLQFPGIDNNRADQPVRVVTGAGAVAVTLCGFEL